MFKPESKNSGVAAMITLLLIGSIVVAIAIAGGAVLVLNINSTMNIKYGGQALYVARGGAQDAIEQVLQNKNFGSACPGYSVPINIGVGGNPASATVKVDNVSIAGQTKITSWATVSGRTRIVEVILSIDPVSGQISISSFKEKTLIPC